MKTQAIPAKFEKASLGYYSGPPLMVDTLILPEDKADTLLLSIRNIEREVGRDHFGVENLPVQHFGLKLRDARFMVLNIMNELARNDDPICKPMLDQIRAAIDAERQKLDSEGE